VAANADYTSIATERHYRRLLALLDDARSARRHRGAVLHAEGPSDATRKLPLAPGAGRARHGMRVMQEEIFGPILPVLAYGHIDEVIAHVNAA
jgi:coniferyl-aldehyde dehydrogenase